MEVTPEMYETIGGNKNKIFVGYQKCKVYELINVNFWFNCGRYGHQGNNCSNTTTCLKCPSKIGACEERMCVKWDYSNRTYTKTSDIHHSTSDANCQIMKKK